MTETTKPARVSRQRRQPEPEVPLATAAAQAPPSPLPPQPGSGDTVAVAPPPPVILAPPEVKPERPARVPLPNTLLAQHDVVQVTDQNSRLWGAFFMVGDVRNGKVHGFYMAEGRKKEWVTVEEKWCDLIGSAVVRSVQPCSPKWISDHQ